MRNEQVAERWIEQRGFEAYSSTRNMFFEGNVIYSYGHHFPIASIIERDGEKAILFTNDSYSNTTAKHKLDTLRAIPYGMKILYVRQPLDDQWSFKKNEKEFLVDLVGIFGKLIKSRSRFNSYVREAKHLINSNEGYCDFIGEKPTQPLVSAKWALNNLKGNTLRVWCKSFNKKEYE